MIRATNGNAAAQANATVKRTEPVATVQIFFEKSIGFDDSSFICFICPNNELYDGGWSVIFILIKMFQEL